MIPIPFLCVERERVGNREEFRVETAVTRCHRGLDHR